MIPTNPPTTDIPSMSPTMSPTIDYNAIPDIGDYKISARNSSHGNWILCDGSHLDPNEYPKLFGIIGYSFGAQIIGTVNRFVLPNPLDRVIGMAGTNTLGTETGSETVTLSEANLPSHSHMLARNTVSGDISYSSSTYPYLAVSNNEGDRSYDLYATANAPNWFDSGYTGSGSAVDIIQPTVFIGNLFIYAD